LYKNVQKQGAFTASLRNSTPQNLKIQATESYPFFCAKSYKKGGLLTTSLRDFRIFIKTETDLQNSSYGSCIFFLSKNVQKQDAFTTSLRDC
jgi:hypothetical protein